MRIRSLFILLCIAFNAAAEDIQLQEGAPDQYVVQRGDSLWGIAERFLKDPWKWPDIWRMNKETLKSEHRLYPGDVIRLTRENGEPLLSLDSGSRFTETVKLSPSVQGEPIIIKDESVPSVPAKAIQALFAKGGVVMPGELDKAPALFGANDPRVLFGKGDLVYASKSEHDVRKWLIVRMGSAFPNPADPKDILAYELIQVGEAVTVKPGDPQLIRITANEQEILERDRLMPAWDTDPAPFIPHAPAKPFEARVVAALGGQAHAGAWMTVVVDKGLLDGVEEGHVVSLYLSGRSVADPKCLRADKIAFLAGGHRGSASDCRQDETDTRNLPEERSGIAFVYRVFKRLAYALVMQSSQPVKAGDIVRNP